MTSDARNSILLWVVGIGVALGAWALVNSGIFDEKDPCAIDGKWVERTGVVIWGRGEHGSGWGVFFEMETAPPFSKENYPEQVLRDDPIAVHGTYGSNPMRVHSDDHGLYAFGKWSGIMGNERDDCPVFFGENGVFQIEGVSDLQILESPDPLKKPAPGSGPG